MSQTDNFIIRDLVALPLKTDYAGIQNNQEPIRSFLDLTPYMKIDGVTVPISDASNTTKQVSSHIPLDKNTYTGLKLTSILRFENIHTEEPQIDHTIVFKKYSLKAKIPQQPVQKILQLICGLLNWRAVSQKSMLINTQLHHGEAFDMGNYCWVIASHAALHEKKNSLIAYRTSKDFKTVHGIYCIFQSLLVTKSKNRPTRQEMGAFYTNLVK